MNAEPTHLGPDPVAEALLGVDAGAGGPFALLGITHATTDPPSVRAALRRRLDQIDRHPRRGTPEAEELRLALHAAAAQVLDPSLHAELTRHWPEGAPAQPPAAWRTHLSDVSDTLVRRARLIVGASGGWGPRARTRLAHLARVHRVSATDLIGAIRPRRNPKRAELRPAHAVRIEIDPPASTGRLWLLVHGVLAGLLLAGVTLLGMELISGPAAPSPSPIAERERAPVGPGAAPAAVPGPRSDLAHHTHMIQELRNAARVVDTDPGDAAARGARVIAAFVDRWPSVPSDAREQIANRTAALLAALDGSEGGAALLLDAARPGVPADGPVPWSGRAALGAWWRAWPDTPRSVRDRIDAALSAPIGGGFDDALATALVRWADPARLEAASDWSAWSDALAACDGAPASPRAQARLALLESVLVDGAGTPDRLGAVLEPIAAGLAWRSGDPSRAWLIERLDDPRVPSDRLRVLTELLATRLSVPGVDPSMVLPANAGREERAALASAYRAAWVTLAGVDDAVRGEVLEALGAALAAPRADAGDLGVLLALARSNAAAAALYGADPVLAAEFLANERVRSTPGPTRTDTGAGLDDAWAAGAFGAEDPDAVLRLLNHAGGASGPIGPLAAEWIMTQAAQGATREARELAREVVVTRSWDIQILLAIERAALRRPSVAVGRLVTEISDVAMPPSGDARWSDAVRNALLPLAAERLVAGSSDELVYAELELAELASRRIGGSSDTALLHALVRETDAWHRRNTLPANDRLSAASAEARRGARAAGVRASTQRVAIQHRAMVEALAGALVSQGVRPRPSVEREMDRLGQSWSDAGRMVEQLIASQRAEAALWRALLEGSL